MAKVALASSSSGNGKNKNPRDKIQDAIVFMGNYRLPHGEVRMDDEDTGVIVAIILYFIAREPSIGMTKLECYLILLDRLCETETGRHLFHWTLAKNGRIPRFKRLIDFMIDRGLIQRRGKYQFDILENAADIIKQLLKILKNILKCLDTILADWGGENAQYISKTVFGKGSAKKYFKIVEQKDATLPIVLGGARLIDTLHEAIDRNTQRNIQEDN